MPNYLIYPFKTMRITQSYTGTVSHLPHTTGSPKDYPIDEGGKDGGRDPVYAPCDLVVKRVYGIGNSGVNTVWLESTEPVKLANGKTDYITMQLTHPNDSDVKRLKSGMLIKKGDYICYEGTDGATGNHIHMSIGMGRFKGNGWTPKIVIVNGKKKTVYVLTTTGGTLRPEEAFFVDPNFTTVKDSKGLVFKTIPSAGHIKKYTAGKYTVNTDALNVRDGTAKSCHIKDVLTRGTKVDIDHVKVGWNDHYWGKIIGKGWIDLEYCKKA